MHDVMSVGMLCGWIAQLPVLLAAAALLLASGTRARRTALIRNPIVLAQSERFASGRRRGAL
jgi:hypothetical protein